MHNIKDLRKNLSDYKKKLSYRNYDFKIDEFESLTPIMDVNEILNLTEQLNRSKNATGGLAGIINL